jgi:hypothetical protein
MSYPLNRANVKEFIAASAPDARDAARKFIKATTHISFETFIRYVNKNLREVVKLVPDSRPMFVYIDTGFVEYKTKSSYWLYLYVKKIVKTLYDIKVEFVDMDNFYILQDNDILLILDDCAYSGSQISGTVAELDANDKMLNIIVFIPFISNASIKVINDAIKGNESLQKCKFSYLKYAYKIKPLSDYMTAAELSTILKYDISNPRAAVEIKKYPIYFDHKLADDVSTFTTIYNGFVPNDWNLQIMASIEERYKLLQQPGLKNAKNIRKEIAELRKQYQYISLFSDSEDKILPMPPYKEKFSEKIKPMLDKLVTRRLSKGPKTRRYGTSSSVVGTFGSRISSNSLYSSQKLRTY